MNSPGNWQLNLSNPVVCVLGPTASGKSELSQRIAEAFDGEVVSADSMQIYKGMDIGTGKVLPQDRRVVHWGLDLLDIGQPYSAALFQTYARECFADIDNRNKLPVLCGGTGFYVRAAIDDYKFPEGEQLGNEVRERYTQFCEANGPRALWLKLQEADPESAELIEAADSKRVVRAFELLASGTSYATQKEMLAHIPQAVPAFMLGLMVEPDELRVRIDQRVDEMFETGLVSEVEHLLSLGLREALTASQAIGYKEIIAALDGNISLDDARQQIKFSTHRYAKRQRTWFRKDKRIVWIDANSRDSASLFEQARETLSILN